MIIAQFLLSPIITRLFRPEEYGAYVLFNTVVINIAVLATLKYADAIVLQRHRTDRNTAVGLSLGICVVISFLTFAGLLTAAGPLEQYFNFSRIGSVIYLIPVGVFLSGIIETLVHVNVSRKKFFVNGSVGFFNNVNSRALNIALGLFYGGKSVWLIIGDFFGKLSAIIVLFISLKLSVAKCKQFLTDLNFGRLRLMASQNKTFPLYYLPANLLLTLSGNIPIFFFQAKFGAQAVGLFALASSMLEIFNRLIPYAIVPVFLQKANELMAESKELLAKKAYQLFGVMLLMSTVIFVGVTLLGASVFSIVFGEQWHEAGVYAEALAIHNSLTFVVVSLSEVYNVTKSQRMLLANTIVNFVLRLVAVLIITYSAFSQINSILIYSLISSLGAIVYLFGIFKILNFKVVKVVAWSAASVLFLMFILLINWNFLKL